MTIRNAIFFVMIESKLFSRCCKVEKPEQFLQAKPLGFERDVLSLMLFRSQILSFAQLGALIYFCCKLMNF